MSEFTAIESKTDYQIISAVITNSDRNTDLSVDIKRAIDKNNNLIVWSLS